MNSPAAPTPSLGGKMLLDLGPLLVFFLANFLAPVPQAIRVFVATGAFMAAMLIAMLISQLKYRHISPLLWFSGIMVVIFGGLTIWLHDESFIKLKPTLYYLLVAGLLGFGLATRRNLMKAVLGSVYPGLSERGWHLLTRNWVIFFVLMAAANEAVWRSTSTDNWIAFKLWVFLPATFLFMLANVPMLMRYGLVLQDEAATPPEGTAP